MKRERNPYLRDREWTILEPLMPPPAEEGREMEYEWREILNGIFYILRAGCAWRMWPHDLPDGQSVYGYFRKWRQDGTWERINQSLNCKLRTHVGKEPEPSVGILDSQSVKTAGKGRRVAMTRASRSRAASTLVDTLGLVMKAWVTAANVQDGDAAILVLDAVLGKCQRLILRLADSAYWRARLNNWLAAFTTWKLSIVKALDGQKGFQIQPWRWVVERTFAWLGKFRRFSKDYEFLPETSESMIYAAMSRLTVTRLAMIM